MYQDLSQKIWGLQVREWRRVGQEWGTFEKLSVLVTFSTSQAGFKTLYSHPTSDAGPIAHRPRFPERSVGNGRELSSGRQST